MVSVRRLLVSDSAAIKRMVRSNTAMAEKSPNLESPVKKRALQTKEGQRKALQTKELYVYKRPTVTGKSLPPQNPPKKRAVRKSLVQTTKSLANESPAKKSPAHKRPSDEKPTKLAGKPFQYRSNLRPLFQLIKKKNFSEGHIAAFKKTPFWLLLDAFISKRVNYDHIRKNDWLICDIIKTYSKETKAFKIGETRITLTDKEISLIFGIQSGPLPLLSNLSSTTYKDSPFVQRHFNNVTELTKPLLERSFEKAFKGTTTRDFEDVARIMCLYLCCTLFFPTTGHRVKWGFVRCIEDLEAVKDYAWSRAITKALMTSIKSVVASEGARGCAVLLPYFICEHTLFEKTKADARIPRFLKWDLRILATSMKDKPFNQVEVTQLELAPNEEERTLFPELQLHVQEETQEDDPQQRESEVPEDKSQGDEETQALEVDGQQELHTNTSSLLEKYTDAQSRILQLSRENDELKEQNAKLGAENSKLKDEIKKKKSETASFVDEVDNLQAHNLRHDIGKKAKKAELPRQVSQLSCEVAAQKATLQADIVGTKCVRSRRIKSMDDIYSSAKKQKKFHILKFPKNSEVLQHLEEQNILKLQTMIETEDPSSYMWKFQGFHVTVQQAFEMLNEGETSHNVIESFIDILMRRQPTHPPADRAHIFNFNSLSLITGKDEHVREQVLDNPVKKLLMENNYRYLIFPINSAVKNPYHWTVLVCDICKKQWIHYISANPRNDKDALVVKKYIEKLRKTINNKDTEQGTRTPNIELLTPEYSWEFVSSLTCPQQDKYSVDCGIIACYVIHCFTRKSMGPIEMDKTKVQTYRAHILASFLHDEANSYLLKKD